MSILLTYLKTAAANLEYGWDWSSWLAPGESITSSNWAVTDGLQVPTADPLDLLVGAMAIVSLATGTTVWLSKGIPLTQYTVTNTVTTSLGRTDSRSFIIDIQVRSN